MKVRSFDVGSQSEGCVADDELGHLYIGEEDRGIWKYGAEPTAGRGRTAVGTVGDGHLVADVEGLSIAYGAAGSGYLIASSQGDSTFAVYERGGSNTL
jgi:3-phytase